ncbi:MAG: glycosyltransferase family 1 protein, partial [Patescibacteria group bacterium]
PSPPLQLPLGQGERTTWHASPFPFAWTQTRFAWELFKKKPDVLFMPIQQLPIFRPHKTKTVAVIHDLAFHEYNTQTRYKDWLLLHTFSAQVANEADAIIAVSQATKDDIKKYYGRTHNVHVVRHGIDHDRFRVFSDEEKETGLKKLQDRYKALRQAQGKPYILFVGQIQPRKNIIRLVEAFERLARQSGGSGLSLIIAGGHGWNNTEIYKRIAASTVRDRIIVTGAVPDELLPTLYANAEVFVLPSLQEGFGIPLIEAAACGVPIVTSNVSSMKEIAEGAGILVDPKDSTSIADGIEKALNNKEEYIKKSITMASKYSWDKTAQETLRIIKGVTHI